MNMMPGLAPEQGPPLKVPLRLFSLGASALLAAGLTLAMVGPEALSNRYLPGTLALTHLVTLGFLGAVMLGALYQMVPVVAGTPLPAPALAGLTTVSWGLGVAGLVSAFFTGAPSAYVGAGLALGLALASFLGPFAVALARAPTRSLTVTGLRVAGLALALAAGAGLMLTWARAGLPASFSVSRAWSLHVGVAALVWVAGLIAAVSWQVLPMFYTAPAAPRWASRTSLGTSGLAMVGGVAAWVAGADPRLPQLGFALAALVALGVSPAMWAWQIRRRRRRRADASLRFWKVACGLGPVVAVSWGWASQSYDPRAAVLAGWLFFVGWAALIVHGMLTRIVPFLIWFHRFSALMGKQPVPPMRQLWPDRRADKGLALHLVTGVLGALSILTGWAPLAHLAGVGLAGLGGWLLYCFVAAYRAAA